MTANLAPFDPTVGVTKKEFKLVYRSMKNLVDALNKEIRTKLEASSWARKFRDSPTISVDMSTFKQAWETVKIGKCPVYVIIHIHPKKDSETYLALDNFVARVLQDFATANDYNRIINKIFTDDKPVGKRKDRFRAFNSFKYPWFGLYIRGRMNPTNDNFRIVIKSERVFRDIDSLVYISSRKEENENG